MSRSVRIARFAALASSVAFAVILVATKAGRLQSRPWLLTWLGIAVLAAGAGALGVALRRLAREGDRRGARLAECVLFLGLVVTSAAGIATWAVGMRGYVILTEGDAVPLDVGGHLAGVSAGPMAPVSDLAGTLRLTRLELRPDGAGGFTAASILEMVGADGTVRKAEVGPEGGASIGSLRLLQGAFGFAPRLILQKDGVTVFDQRVHFTTRRDGPRGIAFEGELDVAEHGLRVVAAMDLSGLDDQMKGHPVLVAELRRAGEALGVGRLQPGHGATVREGWHLGYGGLAMWSEIDMARRSSRAPAILGMVLVLAGAVAWPIAGWRRW